MSKGKCESPYSTSSSSSEGSVRESSKRSSKTRSSNNEEYTKAFDSYRATTKELIGKKNKDYIEGIHANRGNPLGRHLTRKSVKKSEDDLRKKDRRRSDFPRRRRPE